MLVASDIRSIPRVEWQKLLYLGSYEGVRQDPFDSLRSNVSYLASKNVLRFSSLQTPWSSIAAVRVTWKQSHFLAVCQKPGAVLNLGIAVSLSQDVCLQKPRNSLPKRIHTIRVCTHINIYTHTST